MPEQVNLIIYLNSMWDPNWGGNLELWNGLHDKLITPVQQISPKMVNISILIEGVFIRCLSWNQ